MALTEKLLVHIIFLDTVAAWNWLYQIMFQKTVKNMFNYKWYKWAT